jgi:hypothetical protein
MTDRRPYLWLAALVALTLAGPVGPAERVRASSLVRAQAAGHAAPQVFVHPGVVVSKAQLDLVKLKLAAGAQPWRAAYDAMRKSSYASLSWNPRPRATVECGSRSNPNRGCSDEREDAVAAYTHALLWYLTGDQRHANKSIEIMDAWSATIERHTNSNARLQAGWSGASFSRAAELIRHTNAGWPAARVNQFARTLRTVYLPTVSRGAATYNGNWELIMTDAAIGIAVFLEDGAAFDKAVTWWRGRVPAFMYLTSDGPLPVPPPGGTIDTKAELIKYWHGQSTFTDGHAQETCRDFAHTGWGIAAAAHTAETARHQGLDLYAEARGRFAAALEFHAAFQLGKPVPKSVCGGKVKKGFGPVAEVGYNHLHNRLGLALPQTRQLLETQARPGGVSHFIAWETLTHADNP